MYVLAHNSSGIWGGGEMSVARLLAGLQERGHRVKMICRSEALAERAREEEVPARALYMGGDLMLPHALRFAGLLRRERPDALLLSTFKRVFLAALGARLAGVPRVVQRVVLSSDVPRGYRYRLAFRHMVDEAVVNAGGMRAGFLAADPALDPRRVRVVEDGVVTPVCTDPGLVRRELGLPDSAWIVGGVTRLAGQKRLDRLIRALPLLPERTHVVLAGEGDQRSALEALAWELSVADRVHLLGHRTDVGNVLDALDLFVMTSEREGMANAMLEAMAWGVPVVSTTVSGAREALNPDGGSAAAGALTEPEPERVAETLHSLLSSPSRLAEMRAAARERHRRLFSFERMLEDWEAVLLGRPAPAAGEGR